MTGPQQPDDTGGVQSAQHTHAQPAAPSRVPLEPPASWVVDKWEGFDDIGLFEQLSASFHQLVLSLINDAAFFKGGPHVICGFLKKCY